MRAPLKTALLAVALGAVALMATSCAGAGSARPASVWTVLSFDKSQVAVPAGWSVRLWHGDDPSSPWTIWLTPSVPHLKPIIVSAGPSGGAADADQTRADLAYVLKDFEAQPMSLEVVKTASGPVACGTRRGKGVYVACYYTASGHESATILLWMDVTDDQLNSIGGLRMLGELATRAQDLPYVERRME